MQISVGTTDGKVWDSDFMSKQDIMEEGNLTEEEFQYQMKEMRRLFKDFDDLRHLSLTVKGEDYILNPANIVWVRVRWDD